MITLLIDFVELSNFEGNFYWDPLQPAKKGFNIHILLKIVGKLEKMERNLT